MSKMQKYTLMGLMLLILCLVTWALATGLGILQGNAAAAAAQETAEGVSYLKKLEKQDVTEVETILQEREREHQQEQIQTGQVDESSVWDQLKDVVIMGDSRAVGFYYFKFLDHSRVLATGGATIADIEGQMGTLKALNPPQLFLCYGLNDIRSSTKSCPTPPFILVPSCPLGIRLLSAPSCGGRFLISTWPSRRFAQRRSTLMWTTRRSVSSTPTYGRMTASMCGRSFMPIGVRI